MLINNLTEVNRGETKIHIPSDQIFGFCKTFNKITEKLRFHLTFKAADIQDIIYTTLANDITVTNKSFYLFVPILIPSVQTQAMFNESIRKNIYNLI